MIIYKYNEHEKYNNGNGKQNLRYNFVNEECQCVSNSVLQLMSNGKDVIV